MKIILTCYAGMSSSLLVRRMRNYAQEQGIELTISAVPITELSSHLQGVDLVLLGPQISCMAAEVRLLLPASTPILAIDKEDYGLLRGDEVMKKVLAKLAD